MGRDKFNKVNHYLSSMIRNEYRVFRNVQSGEPVKRITAPGLVMMTSSNETYSALLVLCAGNSPVTGEFPSQRPVTRSFDDFFELRLNKRLSEQSRCWWFETPSGSVWRDFNVINEPISCSTSHVLFFFCSGSKLVYVSIYLKSLFENLNATR